MGSSRTPTLPFAPPCILRCIVLHCACCRICVLEFAIAAAKSRRYAFAVVVNSATLRREADESLNPENERGRGGESGDVSAFSVGGGTSNKLLN